MTEPSNAPAGPRRGALVRDMLVIVLTGAALGLGFNALQLGAEPARALPWMHRERGVVSLDQLAPQGTAPAPTPAAAPVAPPTPPPAVDLATKPGKAPATADSAAARHVPAKGGKAAPKGPKPAPVVPVPVPATTAAPSAAAANLPAIPDSRDPIECKLDVAQKFHAAGAALFLDARSPEEYAEGHIAGAVNLPFDDVFKNPALAKAVDPKGRPVIAYCGGGDCELSRSLAFALIDAGLRKVLVFTGGLPAWREGGQPVHTGTQP